MSSGSAYSSPQGSGSASSPSYSSPSSAAAEPDSYGTPAASPVSSGSVYSSPVSSPSQSASDSYDTPAQSAISSDSSYSSSVSTDYAPPTGAILDAGGLESGSSPSNDDYGVPQADSIGNGPFSSTFDPSPRISEPSSASNNYGSTSSASPSSASPSYLGPDALIAVASPPDPLPPQDSYSSAVSDPIIIDITGNSNTYSSPSNDIATVVNLRDSSAQSPISGPASDDYGLPNAPPLAIPSYSRSRISDVS